jgi:hypothetical protein
LPLLSLAYAGRAHSSDRPLPPAGHLSTPVSPASATPDRCPGLSASPPPSSRYQGALKHWFYFPGINSFPFRQKSSRFPSCMPSKPSAPPSH